MVPILQSYRKVKSWVIIRFKNLATEYFGIVLVIPYRAQCLVEKTRPTLAFNQIQI